MGSSNFQIPLPNIFQIVGSALCTNYSSTMQCLASHQVSNNWIASVSFSITREVLDYNHLIYNVQNLLSPALIKDLVGSPIAWALPPKRFRIPSICDPNIPWWHHAQCGSLQCMVRYTTIQQHNNNSGQLQLETIRETTLANYLK